MKKYFSYYPELDILGTLKDTCLLNGEFKLRSGAISDIYFDKYMFMSDHELMHDVCYQLCRLTTPTTEAIVGLELGATLLAAVMSQHLEMPCAFIRKEPKIYGTCKVIEGADLHGKDFILVEDVVTTGGAAIKAMEMLMNEGLMPSKVICVIDRGLGGKEAIERFGVPFEAVYTLPLQVAK